MKIQIGDDWQNKHDLARVIILEVGDKFIMVEFINKYDLTRVIVLEITDKYFLVGNAAYKMLLPKKFRTKLEKEAFFKYFEPVPELILTLE
jgi:hypothetical protein